jgi:hypothetical protein
MSSAYHAMMAGTDDQSAKVAKCTDDELEEIQQWERPKPIEVNGIIFDYEDATKEERIGLDCWGFFCDPDDPDAVTVGTPDYYWIHEIGPGGQQGRRVAVVVDIKRSAFTSEPDSLQIHAYAQAIATKHGCDSYLPGIFVATEGEYQWGDEVVFGTDRHHAILNRIIHAIQNRGDGYTKGHHCGQCYGRMRCPAYALAPSLLKTELGPCAEGGQLTSQNALDVYLAIKSLKELAEAAEVQLKAAVERGLVLKDGGKVYLRTMQSGRKSLDKELLKLELGADLSRFEKVGSPFPQFKWIKEKP